MNRKIGHQLVFSYLAVIVILFLTFTTVFHRYYRTYNQDRLQDQMVAESFALSQTLLYALDQVSDEELEELAADFRQATGARVTVIDPAGTVLAETETDRRAMENHLERAEFQQAFVEGQGIEIRRSETLGEDFLYVARPVFRNGELLGYVRISITTADALQIPEQMIVLERLSMLIAALVALLSGAYFSGNISRPIREMTSVVGQIGGGQYDVRAAVRSRNELGVLARGINQMAQGIQNNLQKVGKVKEELEDILNHLNTAVVFLDQNGRVRMMNARAAQLFAADPEQALRQHHLQVIRDYALDKAVRKAIREQKVQSLEMNRYLPELKILEVVLIPVKDEEEIQSVVVSIHDVTEIRMAEQIRTEFVANASHELKTPLTTIKGFAETLLEGAIDDREAAVRFLQIIDEEASRLNRLTEDLLSLARLESRGILIQPKNVNLKRLVERIIKRYGPLAREQGVELEARLASGLPAVSGDQDWLSQVLINLVENAIKYIGDGHRIVIEALAEGGVVEVSVADEGIGIPDRDKERVFERFYRVDKGRSRQSGGTGLGLSIVKHVVEAHGGSLGIRDRSGGGTVIWFRVPAVEKED